MKERYRKVPITRFKQKQNTGIAGEVKGRIARKVKNLTAVRPFFMSNLEEL